MEFSVPQGGSNICHIDVYPATPVKGVAQDWRMVNTSLAPEKDVDRLDVQFARASTPQQRQLERMIFVFSIAESVQTDLESWRFFQGGIMYCEGKADYLDDNSFALSDNGKALTMSVKCLTDIAESYNFSFMAVQKTNESGECQIYASSDPGGDIRRV
tara:strand:+ start:73500 stop:73973 length:474 start_codon:yes stop_codon:yes gene_type:complete